MARADQPDRRVMRLGLSSDAAPGAPVAEIAHACARRGLAALELTLDLDRGIEQIVQEIDSARGAGPHICGLFTDDTGYVHELASLSRHADAPAIIGGTGALPRRIAFARSIAVHGGSALVLVEGPSATWLDAVTVADVEFAWQIDGCTDPAGEAERILERTGRIAYVRLVGGGPEAAMQEGQGVGALMRRLALARFDGPLVLTPSSQRYRLAWGAWLGRRGGWGCGSKADRARGPLAIQQ